MKKHISHRSRLRTRSAQKARMSAPARNRRNRRLYGPTPPPPPPGVLLVLLQALLRWLQRLIGRHYPEVLPGR